MSESESRELNLTERMIPMKGGKQYLPVADRIVWFRDEYPEGTIETKLVELDREQQFCMYHARVTTGKGGVAEASGTETARDFGDYIEKAETKAVGRALGYLGYGTASAGFEEGQRIVDAPQAARRDQQPAQPYNGFNGTGTRPAPPARTTPPAAQPVADQSIPFNKFPKQPPYAPQKAVAAEIALRATDDWTAVWTEAKAQGIQGRTNLAAFLGVAESELPAPAAILEKLRAAAAKRPASIAG